MYLSKDLDILQQKLQNQDWFSEIELTKHHVIVYVKYMNHDVYQAVPRNVGNYQVLLHYEASKNVKSSDFVNNEHVPFLLNDPVPDVSNEVELISEGGTVELSSDWLEYDLTDLCKELHRLKRICSANVLENIFFEEHDGDNCVTNLSEKFPEIRKSIHILYSEFGFDVIYNEIELINPRN